jgi:hypothetical protein
MLDEQGGCRALESFPERKAQVRNQNIAII